MPTIKLNNVTALTESGGTVTLNSGVTGGSGLTALGTVASGVIGSAVTGFTGIKEVDWWRLTSAFTGNAGPIDSNLERVDTANFTKIGTGMTHSSGIFTFPSTGIWRINMEWYGYSTGSNRYIFATILTSPDSGSNWSTFATGKCLIADIGEYGHASSSCGGWLDVTDETTFRAKFHVDRDASGTEVTTQGSSGVTYNGYQFMRIGDT